MSFLLYSDVTTGVLFVVSTEPRHELTRLEHSTMSWGKLNIRLGVFFFFSCLSASSNSPLRYVTETTYHQNNLGVVTRNNIPVRNKQNRGKTLNSVNDSSATWFWISCLYLSGYTPNGLDCWPFGIVTWRAVAQNK